LVKIIDKGLLKVALIVGAWVRSAEIQSFSPAHA
jgi:hypothetical protein